MGIGASGGVILFLAWPSTDGFEKSGNMFIAVVGMLVTWLGNAMLFVGLVGWEVKVGREASPESPA